MGTEAALLNPRLPQGARTFLQEVAGFPSFKITFGSFLCDKASLPVSGGLDVELVIAEDAASE
jgi:hypothetical protein